MGVAYKSETKFMGMCVCWGVEGVLMKMWTGMYQVQNLAKVIMYHNFLFVFIHFPFIIQIWK
jgi:hypothetical protein